MDDIGVNEHGEKKIVSFIKKIVAMRLKHGTSLRLENIVKDVRFLRNECRLMNV